MPMDRFRYGERVIVSDRRHHLYGRRGVVVQIREADGAARVKIDGKLDHETDRLIMEGILYEGETILFPGHCERYVGQMFR